MQLDDFTDVSADIIMDSIKRAKDKNQGPAPEHLLMSMLEHVDSPVLSILINHQIDKAKITTEMEVYFAALPVAEIMPDDKNSVVNVTPRFVALLERAKKSAHDAGDTYIDALTRRSKHAENALIQKFLINTAQIWLMLQLKVNTPLLLDVSLKPDEWSRFYAEKQKTTQSSSVNQA